VKERAKVRERRKRLRESREGWMYSCQVETGQGDLEEGEDQKSSLQHSDDFQKPNG
jgi:hypothetical protein